MIRIQDSHLDHGLTDAQINYIFTRFGDRTAFFIETFTLPDELGAVPCGLYGPMMGDAPVDETDVSYAKRGERAWSSRLISRPMRPTKMVTVIGGPHEEKCTRCGGYGEVTQRLENRRQCPDCRGAGKLSHICVLYTAFGGPATPQEPGDPGCKDVAGSKAFWAEHALAVSNA